MKRESKSQFQRSRRSEQGIYCLGQQESRRGSNPGKATRCVDSDQGEVISERKGLRMEREDDCHRVLTQQPKQWQREQNRIGRASRVTSIDKRRAVGKSQCRVCVERRRWATALPLTHKPSALRKGKGSACGEERISRHGNEIGAAIGELC